MKRAVAFVTLMIIFLTGCGPSTTDVPAAVPSTVHLTPTRSSTPPAPTTNLVEQWRRRGTETWGAIQEAWDDMAPALGSRDFPKIQAACRQIGDVSRQFGALLPTPEPDATELLRKALAEFTAAELKCQTFGPGLSNADIAEFNDHIEQAGKYMMSAGQAL